MIHWFSGQTQRLALQDLKDDADRTVKHAEVHGTFVVQRMHSHSGLNTVEEMPSEYMWDMATSFEKRLGQYIQAISSNQLFSCYLFVLLSFDTS